MTPADMDGNCPVQGYEIRDGWLFYFRARDTWELRAWAPGHWVEFGERVHMSAAEYSVWSMVGSDRFGNPDHVVDDEGEGFPEASDGENWYPGWWSKEFAASVANWAIDQAFARVAVAREAVR